MSVYDFLKAYNLELQRREDLVISLDFTGKLFNEYLFETILGLSSFAAAIYLSVNKMAILGIGQAVIVGIYIYSAVMRKESKNSRKWPPTLSVCPNGYLEEMDTGLQQVICKKIGVDNPSKNDIFYPTGKTPQELCTQARNDNLYWDQCQG